MAEASGDRNDWVVAIPSFDRPQEVQLKTLAFLAKAHFPPSRTFVFVQEDQFAKYEEAGVGANGVTLLQGGVGICRQRNSIMRYFPQGSLIVEMDDDIEGIDVCTNAEDRTSGASKRPLPAKSFPLLVNHLWRVAGEQGCSLWGLYPVGNPFWMSHSYNVGLVLTTGQVQGYANPGAVVTLTSAVMEDYERELLLFSSGGIMMRANFLVASTVNRSRGGCSSAFKESGVLEKNGGEARPTLWEARARVESEAATGLRARYPDLLTIMRPNRTLKIDPVHGEVYYQPPGWRLKPPRSLTQKVWRKDIVGEFAQQLGLEKGAAAEDEEDEDDDEDDGEEKATSSLEAANLKQEEEDSQTRIHQALSDEYGSLFEVLMTWKVPALRNKCKEANLPSSGRKLPVVARLLQAGLGEEVIAGRPLSTKESGPAADVDAAASAAGRREKESFQRKDLASASFDDDMMAFLETHSAPLAPGSASPSEGDAIEETAAKPSQVEVIPSSSEQASQAPVVAAAPDEASENKLEQEAPATAPKRGSELVPLFIQAPQSTKRARLHLAWPRVDEVPLNPAKYGTTPISSDLLNELIPKRRGGSIGTHPSLGEEDLSEEWGIQDISIQMAFSARQQDGFFQYLHQMQRVQQRQQEKQQQQQQQQPQDQQQKQQQRQQQQQQQLVWQPTVDPGQALLSSLLMSQLGQQ